MDELKRNILIASLLLIFLAALSYWAHSVSPESLRALTSTVPLLPLTLLIALVDSFNPCTFWVLSFLLIRLLSVSYSRTKILLVGYSFILVTMLICFLFMAALLSMFLYVGYIDYVRIAVAVIALIAGGINIKDYFFFKKGVSLTIPDQDRPLLLRGIERLRRSTEGDNNLVLVGSSLVFAAFASLVELPCTGGWPLIYTGILSQHGDGAGFLSYAYLLLYCLIYIIPLVMITLAFAYFLKGRQISELQVRVIKLISGVLMLALGILLLVRPELFLP